ncbi:TPA: hypothetical protein ACGL9B_001189 [Streptococcus agalactiae]
MKGIQAEAGVDAYIIEGEAKAGFKVFGLNIDARAIIAIAIAESSLGTQGVATAPGANMFGFGAFDNNTTNAQNFSDDKAVIKMTQETIIQNQNTSFAIQDQKAQLLSTGNLNVAARGGVYCTELAVLVNVVRPLWRALTSGLTRMAEFLRFQRNCSTRRPSL